MALGATAQVGHLESLRTAELCAVRGYFQPGTRVLELGAGSGYQAAILSSWGCHVVAIDVRDRPRSSVRPTWYLVLDYDGQRIPFRACSFDIVFSSNVLEHVRDLTGVLGESRRVLKEGGLAIHIVPTSAWRFWTSVAHYGYLLKRLVGCGPIATAVSVPSAREVLRKRGLFGAARRVFFPGPHGTGSSAMAELRSFRSSWWLDVFRRAGFELVEARPAGPFYTGYCLLPWLPVDVRIRLARYLGPGCRAFVLRKDGECSAHVAPLGAAGGR